MARTGRPTDYTPELADRICALIEEGVPAHRLRDRDKGMPSNSAFHAWLERYPDFADKYARAKERLADRYAAEVVTIADEADATAMKGIEHARTRMDARKWASGKLAPKKYGDNRKVELDAKLQVVDQDEVDSRLARAIAAHCEASGASEPDA